MAWNWLIIRVEDKDTANTQAGVFGNKRPGDTDELTWNDAIKVQRTDNPDPTEVTHLIVGVNLSDDNELLKDTWKASFVDSDCELRSDYYSLSDVLTHWGMRLVIE